MINNDPVGEFIARDIGFFDNILWCFNGHHIILWDKVRDLERKYQLPYKSEMVALG
jgi:hypothetical protein